MPTTASAVYDKGEVITQYFANLRKQSELVSGQPVPDTRLYTERPKVRVERSHTVSTPPHYCFTPVTAVSEAPDPAPDRKNAVSDIDYGSRFGRQNLIVDTGLTVDEHVEDDATSIQGIGLKNIEVGITAPDYLTEDEKTRFHGMAKFCPTTLLNRDCVLYDRCALIQPCRKFSTLRWHNFCHHGDRCHNSHKVPYTCRSLFYNHECDKNKCAHSHDKAVRMAIEAFRIAHEKGTYGVE